MKKTELLLLSTLLMLGLEVGCCSHPEVFAKARTSLETVQSFYGSLLEGDLSQDAKLQLAVVAADTTLLLAGELQRQWCPEPNKANQLELQTKEAQNLAQEAGVAAASGAQQK